MLMLRGVSVALLMISSTWIASARTGDVSSKEELVVTEIICPIGRDGALTVISENELGQRDRISVLYRKGKAIEIAVAAAEKKQDFEEYVRISRSKTILMGQIDKHNSDSLVFMEGVIRRAEAAAKSQCSLH